MLQTMLPLGASSELDTRSSASMVIVMWNLFQFFLSPGNVLKQGDFWVMRPYMWASRLMTYHRVLSVIFLAPTATKKKNILSLEATFFHSFSSQGCHSRGGQGSKAKGIKKNIQTTRDHAKEKGRPQYQEGRTSKSLVSHQINEKWNSIVQGGGRKQLKKS